MTKKQNDYKFEAAEKKRTKIRTFKSCVNVLLFLACLMNSQVLMVVAV